MLGNTSNSVLSDRVYDLIQELNIIQPTILLSVLPQLEFKLKVYLLLFLAWVMLDSCLTHSFDDYIDLTRNIVVKLSVMQNMVVSVLKLQLKLN